MVVYPYRVYPLFFAEIFCAGPGVHKHYRGMNIILPFHTQTGENRTNTTTIYGREVTSKEFILCWRTLHS